MHVQDFRFLWLGIVPLRWGHGPSDTPALKGPPPPPPPPIPYILQEFKSEFLFNYYIIDVLSDNVDVINSVIWPL